MNCGNSYQRIVKYIVMFLSVILALKYIPDSQLGNEDIIKIACVISVIFVILDLYSPVITT